MSFNKGDISKATSLLNEYSRYLETHSNAPARFSKIEELTVKVQQAHLKIITGHSSKEDHQRSFYEAKERVIAALPQEDSALPSILLMINREFSSTSHTTFTQEDVRKNQTDFQRGFNADSRLFHVTDDDIPQDPNDTVSTQDSLEERAPQELTEFENKFVNLIKQEVSTYNESHPSSKIPGSTDEEARSLFEKAKVLCSANRLSLVVGNHFLPQSLPSIAFSFHIDTSRETPSIVCIGHPQEMVNVMHNISKSPLRPLQADVRYSFKSSMPINDSDIFTVTLEEQFLKR